MTEFSPNGPPGPMPTMQHRSRRGGELLESFEVNIRTTTPVFGGGAVAKQLDSIDIFRVPSIRGNLRMWWRALLKDTELLDTPRRLYELEAQLWGRAADDHGGRSQVEIRIERPKQSGVDDSAVGLATPEGYVLFPSRIPRNNEKGLPRYRPGLSARLIISGPRQAIPALKSAVRAWLLFGGYGSRTRRGLGSLSIDPGSDAGSAGGWLPSVQDPTKLRHALTDLFDGDDILAPLNPGWAPQFPSLRGAFLFVGNFQTSGEVAWKQAVAWLRDFRQGVGFARAGGAGTGRPGRSFWPEADKLRHVFATHSPKHAPRYDGIPVWPRAQFGLPLLGQFHSNDPGEPPRFEITWQDRGGTVHERMASLLTVKAMPVVDGFFPCALWLSRRIPAANVIVRRQGSKVPVTGSAAVFHATLSAADQTVASNLVAPWDGKATVRNAFLLSIPGGKRVAP